MAIDFPSTPFIGQQITEGGTTWQWDGIGWNIVPVLYSALASDTPPLNPADNQQWWRSTNGQMYLWYNDGNSKQWVQSAGSSLAAPDPWACQPIGAPFPLMTYKTGVDAPPVDQPNYRYVKLTAAASYNTGVLTSESVSGSAPLVVATAIISLAASPMNGQTISLWNTERRIPRAGLGGTKQDDAMQGHRHQFQVLLSASGFGSNGDPASGNAGGSYMDTVGAPTTDGTNGTPRTANESRMKNEGVDYYLRIL